MSLPTIPSAQPITHSPSRHSYPYASPLPTDPSLNLFQSTALAAPPSRSPSIATAPYFDYNRKHHLQQQRLAEPGLQQYSSKLAPYQTPLSPAHSVNSPQHSAASQTNGFSSTSSSSSISPNRMTVSNSRRTIHAFPTVGQLMASSPMTTQLQHEAKRIEQTYIAQSATKPTFSSLNVNNLKKTYLSIPTNTEPYSPGGSSARSPHNGRRRSRGSQNGVSPNKRYEQEQKTQWLEQTTATPTSPLLPAVGAIATPPGPPPPLPRSITSPSQMNYQAQLAAMEHAAQLQRLQQLQQQTNMMWAMKLKQPPPPTTQPQQPYPSHEAPEQFHSPPHNDASNRGWQTDRTPNSRHTEPIAQTAPTQSSSSQQSPPILPRTASTGYFTSVAEADLDTAFIVKSGGNAGARQELASPAISQSNSHHASTASLINVHGQPRRELIIKHAAIPPAPASPTSKFNKLQSPRKLRLAPEPQSQQPPQLYPAPTLIIAPIPPANSSPPHSPTVVACVPNEPDFTTSGSHLPPTFSPYLVPTFVNWRSFLLSEAVTLFSVDLADLQMDQADTMQLIRRVQRSTLEPSETDALEILKHYVRVLEKEGTDFIHYEDLLETLTQMNDEATEDALNVLAFFQENPRAWSTLLPKSTISPIEIPSLSTTRRLVDYSFAANQTSERLRKFMDSKQQFENIDALIAALKDFESFSLPSSIPANPPTTLPPPVFEDEVGPTATQHEAATKIQALARGRAARNQVDEQKEQEARAVREAEAQERQRVVQIEAERVVQQAMAAAAAEAAIQLQKQQHEQAEREQEEMRQQQHAQEKLEHERKEKEAAEVLLAQQAAAEEQRRVEEERLAQESAKAVELEQKRLQEEQRAKEAAETQQRIEQERLVKEAELQRQQEEQLAAEQEEQQRLEQERKEEERIKKVAALAAHVAKLQQAARERQEQARIEKEQATAAAVAAEQQKQAELAAEAAAAEVERQKKLDEEAAAAAEEAKVVEAARLEQQQREEAEKVAQAAAAAASIEAVRLAEEERVATELKQQQQEAEQQEQARLAAEAQLQAEAEAATKAQAATKIQALARGRATRASPRLAELQSSAKAAKTAASQVAAIREAIKASPSITMTDAQAVELFQAIDGDVLFLNAYLSERASDLLMNYSFDVFSSGIKLSHDGWCATRRQLISFLSNHQLLTPPLDGKPALSDETIDSFLEHAGMVLNTTNSVEIMAKVKDLAARLDARNLIYPNISELAAAMKEESQSIPVTSNDIETILSFLSDEACTFFPPNAELEVRVEELVRMIRTCGSLNTTLNALHHLNTEGHHFIHFNELLPAVERVNQQLADQALELFNFFSQQHLPASDSSASTKPLLDRPTTLGECRAVLADGLNSAMIIESATKYAQHQRNFTSVAELTAEVKQERLEALAAAEIAAGRARSRSFSSSTYDGPPIQVTISTPRQTAHEINRRRLALVFSNDEYANHIWQQPVLQEEVQLDENLDRFLSQRPPSPLPEDELGIESTEFTERVISILISVLRSRISKGQRFVSVDEAITVVHTIIHGQDGLRQTVSTALESHLPSLVDEDALPTALRDVREMVSNPASFEKFLNQVGIPASLTGDELDKTRVEITELLEALEEQRRHKSSKSTDQTPASKPAAGDPSASSSSSVPPSARPAPYTSFSDLTTGLTTERDALLSITPDDIKKVIDQVTALDCVLFDDVVKEHQMSTDGPSVIPATAAPASPSNKRSGAPFSLEIREAAVARMIRSIPSGVSGVLGAIRVLNREGKQFRQFEDLGPAIIALDQQQRQQAQELRNFVLAEPEVFQKLLPHQAATPLSLEDCMSLLQASQISDVETLKPLIMKVHKKGSFFPNPEVLGRTIFTLNITNQVMKNSLAMPPPTSPSSTDTKQTVTPAPKTTENPPAPVDDLPARIIAFLNNRMNGVLSTNAPLVVRLEAIELISACKNSATLFPEETILPLLHHLSYSKTTFNNVRALHAHISSLVKDAHFFMSNPLKGNHIFTVYSPVDVNLIRSWICGSDDSDLNANNDPLRELVVVPQEPPASTSAPPLTKQHSTSSFIVPFVPSPLPGNVGLELLVHLSALVTQNDQFTKAINDTRRALPMSEQVFPYKVNMNDFAQLRQHLLDSVRMKRALSQWLQSEESGWIGSLVKETLLKDGTAPPSITPCPAGINGLTTIINDLYINSGCFLDALSIIRSLLQSHDNNLHPRPTAFSGLVEAMKTEWIHAHIKIQAKSRAPTNGSMSSLGPSPTIDENRIAPTLPVTSAVDQIQQAANLEKQLELNVTADMSEEEIAEARSQYVSLELAADKLDRAALGMLAWSHPFLRILRSRSTIWEKVCDTNIVRNTSSPSFAPIILNLYRLNHNDIEKDIKIQAYAMDPDGGPPVLFGELTTNLQQLLSSAQVADTLVTTPTMSGPPAGQRHRRHGMSVDKRLVFRRQDGKTQKESGFLIVKKSNIWLNTTAAVLSNSNPHSRLFPYPTECLTQLIFYGRKLEKQGGLGSGKADPFVMIYGLNKETLLGVVSGKNNGTSSGNGISSSTSASHTSTEFATKWSLAFCSEVASYTLNPVFLPALLKVDDLCGGEFDREILVRVMTNKTVKQNAEGVDVIEGDLIGEFETTLKALLKYCNSSNRSKDGKRMHLINPRKKVADKKYKHSGDLVFMDAKTFTLSSRATEIQAEVFDKVEKPIDPNSRRTSLGLASLTKTKSKTQLFGALGVDGTTADLSKSSLLQKAAAIARLTGAEVDQPSQSEMVDSFQRQRTAFSPNNTGSRRNSLTGGPLVTFAAGTSGGGNTSATDRMIAGLLRTSSMKTGSGTNQFPVGVLRKTSSPSGSPLASMKMTRVQSNDGINFDEVKNDSNSTMTTTSGGSDSKRSTLRGLNRRSALPDSEGSNPGMAALASSLMSYRKLAKAAAERRSGLSINFKFKAIEMRKMDSIFGWCDSYLQIFRRKDDVWSELASTTVVPSQKNPAYDVISIRLSKLRSDPLPESGSVTSGEQPEMNMDELSIAGGIDYPLLVKAFHWKKRGEPEFMGSFETNLTELESRCKGLTLVNQDPLSSLTSNAQLAFPLIDPALASDPKKGKDYKHSGLVFLTEMDVILKDKDKRRSKRKTLTIDGNSAEPSVSVAPRSSRRSTIKNND